MAKRLKLSWITALVALAIVAWLLGSSLLAIDWQGVAQAWSSIPTGCIAASLAASLVSFCMLAMLDVIASRLTAPQRVAAKLAAFAGAVSHAFSNTLGFPAVTGGVVRYRIYASAGLGKGDIARIVALAGFGVALGFAVVTMLALLWQPILVYGWARPCGAAILLVLLLLLAWLSGTPRSLRLVRWQLDFPDAASAAAQMLVGGVEMIAAIGALYVLLPAGIAPPFIDFLPIYVGAVLAGLISHVPGGLGVFEVIVLAAFPAHARAGVLAAMLCYRLTYSLVPFALAATAFATFEARRARNTAI
jgi:uncharacterized membrane protein YbhN (UPF0104 family)